VCRCRPSTWARSGGKFAIRSLVVAKNNFAALDRATAYETRSADEHLSAVVSRFIQGVIQSKSSVREGRWARPREGEEEEEESLCTSKVHQKR
jgi:hypothetical protein